MGVRASRVRRIDASTVAIYDDSGTIAIIQDIVGGTSYRGGDGTNEDLWLYGNDTDSYSAIKIEGNGNVFLLPHASAGVRIGFGTTAYVVVFDTTGGGGSMHFKESTTPPAVADFGAIYCKADNKLYFQDGAGVEHTVAFV